MDSSALKKSDLSKRILETRRQTEELKAQLQNLIDSGINSSLECKTTSHSHPDKENIKESQNKVQIIKSYDTAHSQHVAKPSSSRIKLPDTKIEKQEKDSKKVRHYDVNKTREYIRKQKEKRLEQQKLQNEEKKKTELQKQKLQELHKKSLELVTKNVQAKRERSKSRERIDFVRPVKDVPRSRSTSRDRGYTDKNKPVSKINYNKRGKSVEKIKKVPENLDDKNPNLLYTPIPNYMLQAQQQKTKISAKNSPSVHNKIVILSGNSTDKKVESPNSDPKNKSKSLKPINLFNTPKNTNTLYPPPENYEPKAQMHINNKQNSPLNPSSQNNEAQFQMHTNNSHNEKKIVFNKNSPHSFGKTNGNENDTEEKGVSKILDPNIAFLNPTDHEIDHSINSKPLENESNKNIVSVINILEYKNIQNNSKSNINLQSPGNVNLISNNCNDFEKNKSEVAIGTDNLEKFTKETQTNSKPKHDFPPWLQDRRFESNPLNFINTVKRKLQYAINFPTTCVDVAVQSSIAQQNLKPEDSFQTKTKEEIIEILQHSAKSSRKSDLKSFMSHRWLNLDQKTIDNIELIPKSHSNRNLTVSKTSETESESDTSKNIPEISSESGTSLKKNAESVQQKSRIGLDVERLSSLRLRPHSVNKDTRTNQSEEMTQTEATSRPYSAIINARLTKTKADDVADSRTEIMRSGSKICKNDQYTSDFQSGSHSVSTHSNSAQSRTSVNSAKNMDYQIITDPQTTQYSEKHSSNIPKTSERHSKNTPSNISTINEDKRHSSRNITIRSNSLGRNMSHNTSVQNSEPRIENIIKENIHSETETSKYDKISSNISTEMEARESMDKTEESRKSELTTSAESSKKAEKYGSLFSNSHPSATVSEQLSKSDSNLQYVNTQRGSDMSSNTRKFMSIPPLKEPTLSLVVANEKLKGKFNKAEDRNKLLKNISLRPDTNKFADADLNNTNEIHLKFEAEIHLLNDFNESLRQFSEVEKAFNSLKSKNVITGSANKDTQTSVVTKSSTTTRPTENSDSDDKSELSTINFSRDFLINANSSSLNVDTTVSKLDDTNDAEDFFNLNVNSDLSNFENLQSHNFAGMTLRMFEQLIKDEDIRLENLKTILKIREQALLDRTKGELAWLEIQRKHLRETGKLHEASLIKKKQRGILVNHQKERHEMQRLKQMQKAASIERKIILKEQRNLIKHQLSTEKMLSKIKVNAPRERRLSGPLKVIQSHTESIRSETSFSRRSSSDKERETYNVMSHTQSIISMVSEVSGDEVIRRNETPGVESTDMAVKLPSEACGVPISQMKRTLLIREAALQKRRKAAEELLQWHRKLLEEEKRITELESTANTIISQIPNNIPTSPDVIEKYQFKGKQLNQLWFNLTGCEEKRFNENQIYPMSQIALERFCKSARKYSIKTKISKQGSDSEVSEYSEKRTNDSISENIPDQEISHSASIRTESGKSQHSSFKNESVPITTINDYASDFDIESIQDIVNIEDMDVVDKSINQLIDNFNKIQDDISSLSIKQSLKSDADLEPEDSIRSERTDSDVEVSVIETAKTSKEKSFEEINFELTENNKIINSSKTLSALEGINDIPKNYNDSDKSDIKTSSKIYEEISKCTEDKISTEIPKLTTLSEAHPVEEDNLTKSEDIKSDHNGNKTFYQAVYDNTPSIREENTLNIEGRNNLNKSQEILEELSCLKSQTIEDIPSNNKSAVENIHITDEGKDNLSRSEEILLRLSQSEDKHSIIAFTDIFNEDSLRSELKISLDENDVTKSEGVLLELFPVNEKTSADVSSNSFRSKQETNQLPSEDENSASINSCKDILPIKRPPEVEDAKLENKCREDILNGEIISLSLEVISEKPVEIEESSETNKILAETSEEAIVNIATEEISEFSNKIPLVIEDSSVISDAKNHECMAEIHESEDIDIENKSRSILTDTIPDSEKVTDSLHSRDVSLVALEKEEDQSVPLENISEVIESSETDIDERLSENKETKSNDYTKSLKEEDVAIKDTTCEDTLPSIHEKVSEEFSPSEPIITTEESQNDIGENCDSKISETTVSKKIPSDKPFTDPNNLEKHVLEMKTTEIISQQADVISSTTEETDKSQMASIPENLSVLLSKEDINSYEEKELDSLSSSTTGSQSSILNEKDENQVLNKSESVVAEEKSPTCGAVDVKKRVSEIMADTNQASRGDKSPKLQDFYTTTYDLVSPTNSPELGSPTEDRKYMTAKSIFGTEAEEILRKQLAIEQEIKQITEQQHKEQLPYLYVREIPNKPPPPYTPPSSLPVANVISVIPSNEEIESITKYSAKILHKAYASDNLENISVSENTLSLICKNINKECYKFVFDLCKEISKEHYKQFEKEECSAWLQVRKNTRLAVVKPLDVTGLEKHMNKKLKELFGYEKPNRRENAIIKWSRKKRDHVDEILVMESQAEETQWTNYDKDELLVMNEVTNEIMNMLLKETGEVFSKILSKQTF